MFEDGFSFEGLRSLLPNFGSDSAPPPAGSIEAILQTEKVLLDRVRCKLERLHVRVGPHFIYTLKCTKPIYDTRQPALPPILLLHGHSSGAAMWFTIMDKLAEHYTVYAIDLLGWGRSSRPTFPGADGEDAVAWWLDSIDGWRKEMGLEKMTVVGHSLGGLIATRYAVAKPDIVIRLVLVCCGGILHTTGPYSWYWALFFYYSFPQTFARSLRDMGLRMFREFAMRKLSDSWELNEYQFQLAAQPGASGDYAATKMMTFCNGGTSAFFNVPLIAHLHKLTIPTTLVWGAEDPLIPLKFAMVALRRTRSAKLYVIRKADHGVIQTHPDEVMHAILDHVPPGVEQPVAPSPREAGERAGCCERDCACVHRGGAPLAEAEAEAEDEREVSDAMAAVGAEAAEAEAEAGAESARRASLAEAGREGRESLGSAASEEAEAAGGLGALQAAASSALASVRAFIAERAGAGLLSRSSSSATVDSLAHSTASAPPSSGRREGEAAASPQEAVAALCDCVDPAITGLSGAIWASPPWPSLALQREDDLIERHVRCKEHSLEESHAHAPHRIVYL